ncbi:MAG: hypothetical protein GC131_02525 [Alphaproteobacteria bacterium]|nr:hypothetical protein [Alphaproteobacteria bacterium]
MSWALAALFCSFFLAAKVEANRHFRHNGLELAFTGALGGGAVLLLLLPWAYLPADGYFYAVVALSGIGGTLTVPALLDLAARQSGRVTSMYMPVAVFTAFLSYGLLRPESMEALLSDTGRMTGVLGALFFAGFAVQFIRRNDAGWRHFLVVLPAGLIYGALDALYKYVFDPSYPMIGTGIAYAFLTYLLAIFVLAGILARRGKGMRALMTKKLLVNGLIIGTLGAAALVLCTAALVLAPNPAYPGVITIMVPLWLMIYNRARGVPDNASPLAGAVMVVAALSLIWFTR